MKAFYVLTLGLLALTLAACSTGAGPAFSLDGTTWSLASLNGQPVVDGSQASLEFTDGQASGNGSCNGFGGEYVQDGDSLTFGPIVSTLMACLEPGIMEQESAYFTALTATASFRVDEQTLSLFDADGSVLAVFVSAP